MRLGWALGFVAFGLAIAGAVLAYMLPLSAEAQWRHPVASAEVTRVNPGSEDDRASYAVAWTTPDGERLTGTLSPLLADLRRGQRIDIRYAGIADGRATVFLTRRWKSGARRRECSSSERSCSVNWPASVSPINLRVVLSVEVADGNTPRINQCTTIA